MPERSSVFQVQQIGIEATPGVAVAALKRLSSLGFDVGIGANIKTFRPMGQKHPTLSAIGKEWTDLTLMGMPTYTEIVYPWAGILKNVTPTVLSGTANSWVFSATPGAPDTPATFSFEQGSPLSRAHKLNYLLMRAFNMSFNRDEITMGGAAVGRKLTDDAQMSTNEVQTITITGSPTGGTFTLTYSGQTTGTIAYNASAATVQAALEALSNIAVGDVYCAGGALPGTPVTVEFRGTLGQTNVAAMTANSAGLTGGSSPTVTPTTTTAGVAPTDISLVPILGNQTSVYLADAAASLGGASALERTLEVGFDIADRFGEIWALNSAEASFAAHTEIVPKFTAKIKMAADATGMGLLTTMRANSTKFMRIKSVGEAISGGGGNTYLHQVDMALKVTGVQKFEDADGLFAIGWDFELIKDATWGKAIEVTVQNDITAL